MYTASVKACIQVPFQPVYNRHACLCAISIHDFMYVQPLVKPVYNHYRCLYTASTYAMILLPFKPSHSLYPSLVVFVYRAILACVYSTASIKAFIQPYPCMYSIHSPFKLFCIQPLFMRVNSLPSNIYTASSHPCIQPSFIPTFSLDIPSCLSLYSEQDITLFKLDTARI
jgi:hypothetical protein